MTDSPTPVAGDEICPMCSKPKSEHNSNEISKCSKKLVEMGIMRFCGLCGLTKPAEGLRDRCGKCGKKYSFSNHNIKLFVQMNKQFCHSKNLKL